MLIYLRHLPGKLTFAGFQQHGLLARQPVHGELEEVEQLEQPELRLERHLHQGRDQPGGSRWDRRLRAVHRGLLWPGVRQQQLGGEDRGQNTSAGEDLGREQQSKRSAWALHLRAPILSLSSLLAVFNLLNLSTFGLDSHNLVIMPRQKYILDIHVTDISILDVVWLFDQSTGCFFQLFLPIFGTKLNNKLRPNRGT